MSIFSDDIRLTSIAAERLTRSSLALDRGRADVEDYFQGINDDWDMNCYRMTEYVEQGDRIVAIGTCSWTHKRTGKVTGTPKIDLCRFKDGQAIEISEFYDTARVFAAAS